MNNKQKEYRYFEFPNAFYQRKEFLSEVGWINGKEIDMETILKQGEELAKRQSINT